MRFKKNEKSLEPVWFELQKLCGHPNSGRDDDDAPWYVLLLLCSCLFVCLFVVQISYIYSFLFMDDFVLFFFFLFFIFSFFFSFFFCTKQQYTHRFWLEHVDYKYFMTNNLQQRMFAVGEFIYWGDVADNVKKKKRHLSRINYVEWLNSHHVYVNFLYILQ